MRSVGYGLTLTLTVVALVTMILLVALTPVETSDGTRFPLWQLGQAAEYEAGLQCPSRIWVWEENGEYPVCQPLDSDGESVTLYKRFNFGPGAEYETVLGAVEAATEYGDRLITIRCDGKTTEYSLYELRADIRDGDGLIHGIPEGDFCPAEGYLEMLPQVDP